MSEQDCTRRFFFEDLGIRGQWVRLTNSWQAAKQHQPYPVDLQAQLGQALSAVVLLASTIKFDGSLILQTQGTGIIKTLVAQATHNRMIRGLIRCEDNLGSELRKSSNQELFGDGRLVLTINSSDTAAYQGIVPLHGDTLASAIETYFAQSEQLNTRLWLTANGACAAGLLVQQLPSMDAKDDWQRIESLANTLTSRELLDLGCETLLYRLFNEEKVRVFDAESVAFACSCSRSKIETTLRMLGRHEVESILAERGQIEVNCEFCNQHYLFDRIDAESLLANLNDFSEHSQTKH